MAVDRIVVLLLSAITLAYGQLAIENRINENPLIECQTHNVVIRFKTEKPFQGHLYVRGHYEDDDCHKDYLLNRDSGGDMNIPFDKCGMRRQRMTNPKGMAMSSTVVISFHRTFITQVDRAYRINCFYLEADKEVKQSLEVSTISTIDLGVPVPMPTCTYQVLTGGPEGSTVQYARVGDKVFHKWSCSFEMPELYCMIVHSCTVDDGSGTLFEMIDQEGCAKDPVILDDLTYITDLMAGTESSVFKFADKAHLYFTCQVQLSLKHEHDGNICPRPKCNISRRFRFRRDPIVGSVKPIDTVAEIDVLNETTTTAEASTATTTEMPEGLITESISESSSTITVSGTGSSENSTELDSENQVKSRRRRSHDNDFDLVAQPVLVLDLDDALPRSHASSGPAVTPPSTFSARVQTLTNWPRKRHEQGICMSEMSFGLLISVALLAGIGSIVFSTVACVRARNSPKV